MLLLALNGSIVYLVGGWERRVIIRCPSTVFRLACIVFLVYSHICFHFVCEVYTVNFDCGNTEQEKLKLTT